MVRHGETDWNRDNRFQGHADPPLNEAGRAQARTLAEKLAAEAASALYSSPLVRAYETASIVAQRLALEVRISEALREVDVGSWSGLTRAQVEMTFPAGYRRWLESEHGWDDGESYDDLGRRVVAELLEIAARHPDQQVLVVSHGGPIRSALAAAAGVSHGEVRRTIHVLGNCAVVRFAVREGILERVD
jgi:broad specificity phosphatase PhoE